MQNSERTESCLTYCDEWPVKSFETIVFLCMLWHQMPETVVFECFLLNINQQSADGSVITTRSMAQGGTALYFPARPW
jgi:hypothetical protein